jgi:hypothetical protein
VEGAIEQMKNDTSASGRAASEKLQLLLRSMLPHAEEPDAELIAAYVRDGGLNYEAKLAAAAGKGYQALANVAERDVKGAALRVLKELDQQQMAEEAPATVTVADHASTAAPSIIRNLVQSLSDHLGRVESQQAINVLAKATGAPLQIQFPYMANAQMHTAFMAVGDDEQGEVTDIAPTGHNLLLQLDLENLGRTRIDAHVTARSLRAIFYVETRQAVAALEARTALFGDHLRQLGYQDVWLAVRQAAQIPSNKKEQFSMLCEGVLGSVHLVDARA